MNPNLERRPRTSYIRPEQHFHKDYSRHTRPNHKDYPKDYEPIKPKNALLKTKTQEPTLNKNQRTPRSSSMYLMQRVLIAKGPIFRADELDRLAVSL